MIAPVLLVAIGVAVAITHVAAMRSEIGGAVQVWASLATVVLAICSIGFGLGLIIST